MIFGERIKQLRVENKWTQEYVCEKLNISSGALSRYETSMYEPKSLDLVKDFANLFNVSTDYLLGKSDIRNPKQEDPFGLAKIGFNMKDYTPPTETQKQQIKGLLEVIMKDNKKDVGDKKNESK
jgi:transcriptional regulator with XRE-family HTH domain